MSHRITATAENKLNEIRDASKSLTSPYNEWFKPNNRPGYIEIHMPAAPRKTTGIK